MFRRVVLSALALTSILAARSQAEQPRATSCAEKMEKFVESIDELLAKNVLEDEPFWAVIREYLPVKGCNVEEVISISKTSKYSVPPFKEYASYTIRFRNSDKDIFFRLEKDTGNIGYPAVGSTHLPSW
jgi:hypothetical protein